MKHNSLINTLNKSNYQIIWDDLSKFYFRKGQIKRMHDFMYLIM